jgi:hypothetical protein
MYNGRVRKASGAVIPLLLAVALVLAPVQARADAARHASVNPGNAQHLGPADSGTEKQPAEAGKEEEAAAPAPNTEGRDSHADEEPGGAEGIEQAPAEAAASGTEAGAEAAAAEEEEEASSTAVANSVLDAARCCQCRPRCGTLEFYGPLGIICQHPPNLLFLQPPPESPRVLSPGAESLEVGLDLSNLVIRETDSGIIADYDFELLRESITYRRGVAGGELSAMTSAAYRSHGFMDPLIREWHGWFGLPNGLRKRFPDQQYRYIIVTRQGPAFNDDGDALGMGDLTLGYKRPLWGGADGRFRGAARVMLKAPTGSPGKALGSGNWDASVGLLLERQITPHYRGNVCLDWVFIGKPDWQNIAYQDTWNTVWTLERAVSHSTTVLAQFSTHRNPLRLGSTQADKDPQELAFGFHHRLGGRLVWSGGFSEDVNPETAPDFVATTSFRWEF